MLANKIQHLDVRILDVHMGIGLRVAGGSQVLRERGGSSLREGCGKCGCLPLLDTANVVDVHEIIPSVVVRINTVAGRGEVANLSPKGRDQ